MRYLGLLGLIFTIVLPTACRNTPEPRATVPPDSDDPYFPQLAPARGERAYPEALLDGTLIRTDKCLRVTSTHGGTSYLIIWPPQVTLDRTGDTPRIVDPNSGLSVREGEVIRLAGGELQPTAPILSELREPLPESCSGPLWLASGLAPPR